MWAQKVLFLFSIHKDHWSARFIGLMFSTADINEGEQCIRVIVKGEGQ